MGDDLGTCSTCGVKTADYVGRFCAWKGEVYCKSCYAQREKPSGLKESGSYNGSFIFLLVLLSFCFWLVVI